jgi:fibrillarin-like pre-rRNA processing protein
MLKQIFDGIYSDNKSIYTKNLVPGKKVYGEKLIFEGAEFREWNPYRSKYCAGIKNGLKENIFFSGAKVLYLGSAEGTTISHVSDIIGSEGFIFGVDISETAMQKLLDLGEKRKNIFPILGDAQLPIEYAEEIGGEMDVLFQDVSQRNQTEIFLRNAFMLKTDSYGALTIKTKSISQTEKKEDILAKELEKLSDEFKINQIITLDPYEKDHYLILMKKK